MSLRINIISNIHNGSGLQKDYEILKSELESMGHTVTGVDYLKIPLIASLGVADLNLWLEVAQPLQLFKFAKRNWLIPNPEWWRPQWDAKKFDRILCKTQDAHCVFSTINPNCEVVGFMSIDRQVRVEKRLEFLHVAGKSPFKNTVEIVEAWRSKHIPYRLTLVGLWSFPTIDGIRYLKSVPGEDLSHLYSMCAFHLCLSEYEGWGHYIHEGLSAGGIVITTDSPLMRDFDFPGRLMVRSAFNRRHLLGDMYKPVNVQAVIDKVLQVADMPSSEVERLSAASRARYEDEVLNFRVQLAEQLDRL